MAGAPAQTVAGILLLLATAGARATADQHAFTFAYPVADTNAHSCAELALAVERATAGILVAQATMLAPAPLLAALRSGAVGASCLSAGVYGAELPEAGAVAAANRMPSELRRNGGMALLDRLHRDRLGVRYLGWIDSGAEYFLYLRSRPPLRDGVFDLTGLRVRGEAQIDPLLRALGASTPAIELADTFAALDRRELDGAVWLGAGIGRFKWAALLKHRTAPGIYQSDVGVLINDRVWTLLAPRAKQAVEDAVEVHEESSRNARLKQTSEEEAELRRGGLEIHALEPEAAEHLERRATDLAYRRIEEALSAKRLPVEPAGQLRRLFVR
jgi:TRAP-type C4-dicarboxylate transport system substrate-binding protein